MKNKRVTPEQFAEFIAFKTGKNLTCPIGVARERVEAL